MTNIMQSKTNQEMNPVYATTGNSQVSDKYRHISSQALIERLERHGLVLEGTSYGKPRKAEKVGFQKHCMIFTRPDLMIDDTNNLQLLVTNSHDRSTGLQFNTGVFRTVCANGLVVGDSMHQESIRHVGNWIEEKLDDTVSEILKRMPLVAEKVKAMREKATTIDDIEAFRSEVIDLKLGHLDNVRSVHLGSMGQPKRHGDLGQDLYTVFNRYQETAIRGGLRYVTEKTNELTGRVTRRNQTTQKVKSLDKSKKINQALWNLAEERLAA